MNSCYVNILIPAINSFVSVFCCKTVNIIIMLMINYHTSFSHEIRMSLDWMYKFSRWSNYSLAYFLFLYIIYHCFLLNDILIIVCCLMGFFFCSDMQIDFVICFLIQTKNVLSFRILKPNFTYVILIYFIEIKRLHSYASYKQFASLLATSLLGSLNPKR